MKTTVVACITAGVAGLLMGMTACQDVSGPEYIISPPRSGLPFVKKYLVADRNTKFDSVVVVTGSSYGKIVILSDPGSNTDNIFIDPRSGDSRQIADYEKLRAKYGDDQVHATWDKLDDVEDAVYSRCFAEPVVSIEIICDKEYAAGYPAGQSLNSLFSIEVHNIPALVRTYDKDSCWGETYTCRNGELLRVPAGVVAQKMPFAQWNASVRNLVSLIPLFITDDLPDTKGYYSFTVTYTFANRTQASFATPPTLLGD